MKDNTYKYAFFFGFDQKPINFQMPNYPPSIAAVTPSQRNPVPVGEFLQVGRQSTGRNISSSYTGSAKLCDILSNSVGTVLFEVKV